MVGAGEPVHYERPVQARATIRGVIALQLLANGAGALVVFVYLGLLFPVTAPDDTQQLGLNVVVLAMTSIPGPTHLRDGVAPVIVAEVPFILLPALLVSTAFASHVALFRALLRREGDGVVSGASLVRRSAR